MEQIEKYITKTIGLDADIKLAGTNILKQLPMFLNNIGKYYILKLHSVSFLLIHIKKEEEIPTAAQFEKWTSQINNITGMQSAIVVNHLPSLLKMRYIERGLCFIVPYKQLHLPKIWLSISEDDKNYIRKQNSNKLIPAAQWLLLYYLQHKIDLEYLTFAEIADKLKVKPMYITRAIDDLHQNELCQIMGSRPKFVYLNKNKKQLWDQVLPLLKNPIVKEIYIDNKPKQIKQIAGETALSQITSINPPNIPCYAIKIQEYHSLVKKNEFINENAFEGKYKLQVWIYDPETLTTDNAAVDKLSLFLSLYENKDERIQGSLEDLMEDIKW